MKYKNYLVAVLLLALLLGVGAIALSSGGEKASENQPAFTGKLLITEICAKNENILADNSGKYRDYIELYSEEGINLKGFTLTNGKVTSAPLGDITIAAGEYRVIFLSKEITGFAIGASGGDTIRLLAPDGSVAARVDIAPMGEDQVMALKNGYYQVTSEASPYFPNTPEGLAAFRQGSVQNNPQIVISEVLITNESTLPDEQGVFSDAVELHNVSGEEVYLGNFFLSDTADNRFAYRLPDRLLEADEYLVLFCDGENYISDDGNIHANFGLSRGEKLYLTDLTGGYLEADCQSVGEDISWQLMGSGEYMAGTPSLGFANTAEGIEMAVAQRTNYESPLIISEVVLSSAGVPYNGAISDFVEITNRSDKAVPTADWYLSDGGDPYHYPLPETTLMPGECLVIRCDDTQAGFGLSRGETVMLTGPDYRYAPLVTCPEPEIGKSMQLTEDAGGSLWCFENATLGFPNTPQGRENYLKAWVPQGLIISEVMTGRNSTYPDPYSEKCDWVEFYNAGTKAVSLKNYSISNHPKLKNQYPLPDVTLEPGAYFIVLVGDFSGNHSQRYHTLPMNFSSRGETLYLLRDGEITDFVAIPPVENSSSYGRGKDSLEFTLLAAVTPGKANGKAALPSQDPVALTAPGSYDGVTYLEVALSGAGELYYTTNCTIPDRGSTPYTGPIRITETTILRVVCYEEGKNASRVVDFSYILNENDNLPVVSLVTEPDNLWSNEKGIYADGYNKSPISPYFGANFWKNWERPATVTLIETDGQTAFSTNCGLKIFGAFSRANNKKSLACMFRARYGEARLEYPLFGEDSLPYYESFVMRAGGQDFYSSRIRDELITSLAGDYLGLPVQDYRPVALYLNGEYWGVYFIREKLGDQYVSGHFNMKVEDVTLLEAAENDYPIYDEVIRYASSHNLAREEYYNYIASKVDVENFTDYVIAQMWIQNRDASNVKFFLNPDGKWTWALFDTDLSFGDYSENTLSKTIKGEGQYVTFRSLMVNLLRNENYRDYFIRRVAWQVTNVWTQENIDARIDEIYELVARDMEKDSARWNRSHEYWEKQVQYLHTFAGERNRFFISYVQSYFHLTDQQMREYGFPATD